MVSELDVTYASALMRDSRFQDLLGRVESRLFEEWRAATTPEVRESVYGKLQGLRCLLREITATVD